MTRTLATPANMKKYEDAHPPRQLVNATIEPRRAIAWSPMTGEECSASSGDYWNLPAGIALKDSEGRAMFLVTEHTIHRDALNPAQIWEDQLP